MAKAVISSVLESLLGKYVDGLGGDSLQVGLWSGELTLQNLTLKPHALAELQLPITVVNGSIRRVHVVVPWNQLGSASVQVAIEGVFALVTPNTKLPSAEEIRQGKRSLVERQELLRQHDRLAQANNQEGEDESTFLSRLMMRIVDNLQITLRDVHLRYEDKVSNPDVPFACGLMIQSFTFHTTDAEGNDVFVDRTTKKERFLHKAATLASFGLYWDRLPRGDEKALLQSRPSIPKALGGMVQIMVQKQNVTKTLVRDGKDGRLWIVQPCNLRVRITKNETMDFSHAAKYTVHSELNNFSCALSREQYEDILFLNRAFASRRAIEAHFLNARCRPFHSAKDRPRQWWDYAIRLALSKKVQLPGQREYKNLKTVRLRISSARLCGDERRRYIEAFRVQVRKGSPLDPNSKEAKIQSKYEMIYPVDVIMALRNFAEDAESKARLQKLEAEKLAAATNQQSSANSWYGYFFGAAPAQTASPLSPTSETKGSPHDFVLSAEGRANLKKAYDEAVEKEKSHEVPASCNLFAVKVHLRNGQLALYQTKQQTPFFVGSLDASVGVDVRPTFDWDARCRVQHFEILNGLATGTPYHQFCSLGATSGKSGPCASFEVGFISRNEAVQELEDEVVKVNAVRVRFTMAPVRLMVDASFVAFLQSFFVSMLPANQLDKVWSFATSSVSEWIFSDEEEDELYRETLARKQKMEFDVGVDFTAPVVVISESITDSRSPTIVIDFGRFKFQNESTPQEPSMTTIDRLYWSTEMSKVNVLLGRLDSLPPLGVNSTTTGFDHVVEEFNIAFAVDSTVSSAFGGPKIGRSNDVNPLLTPNISAKAVLPSIVVKVSESQITSLGRIHSALQAQLFGSVPQFEQLVLYDPLDPEEEEPNRTVSIDAAHQLRKLLKEKFALKLAIEIGEVLVRLTEDSTRDAFRLRLTGAAFDMAIFASQSVIQARLQAMVMEDCLYDESSKFFYLLSTGQVGEDTPDLIALDVTTFADDQDQRVKPNVDREADTIVTLRCNILHIQWNPSSVALLYQILSAYSTALHSHALNITETTSAVAAEDSAPQITFDVVQSDQASEIPPLLFRASLVQLSGAFNKDQLDRQLVRLAIQDVALEYVVKVSNGRARSEVVGHLGNFTATDLSLAKHEMYTPLIGLNTGDRTVARETPHKLSPSMEPLMTFTYKWSADANSGSSLQLQFEPVRVVYYHQQAMELADYLFEGILGAMVAETLATATRLLLTEESASTLFHVTVKRPTLILPIRLLSPAHWCLTAESLVLEHFPSSVIRYCGDSVDLAKRKRLVELFADGERLKQTVEEVDGEVSIRADCKRVQFQAANIYFASEKLRAGSSAADYTSVLQVPTNLAVEVDDLVSAGSFSPKCQALPRLTIRVRMEDVAFELNRSQYLAVLSLVRNNFGAELLFSEPVKFEESQSDTFRPTMSYSYSRTDLEMLTMQITFEMAAVRCDLYQDCSSAAEVDSVSELVDQAIYGASSARRRERPLATLLGTQLSASVNRLHDQWPNIEVRVDSFSLQDKATKCLALPDNPKTSNTPGIVFRCERPFAVSYAWNDEGKQSKVEMESDDLHGVVVPESILTLLDYFAPPTIEPPASPQPIGTTGRRKSITAAILNEPAVLNVDGSSAYDISVSLRGRNMSIAFPKDLFDGDSEQIAMRADFNVNYIWKPSHAKESKHLQGGSTDLDIQSSLMVDATGIEVFSRNAKRQGCASSSTVPLVQLLEPCDVHVEISDLFPHAGQQQQIVAAKFSPIEVFASYEDSCVVMSVIDSATSSLERHSERVGVAAAAKDDPTAIEIFSSTVEIHRYFTCEVGAMSLTLINDCDGCDMGLLQLQTQRCNLFLNVTYTPVLLSTGASVVPPTTTLSGGGSIVTLISYYNPDSRDWHPMCSEWGVDISVQGSVFDNTGKSQGSDNELHVIVTANHSLDLAVTHGLLEVLASAGGAWNRRRSQTPSPTSASLHEASTLQGKHRQTKAPSVIRNDTGLPLTFWLSTSSQATQSDGGSSILIVSSGNVADLHYTHSTGRGCGVARKYASRDRGSNSMLLHLHLADSPFRPIHGIEFEQLGSRAYPLLDGRSGNNTRFTLNFHSQLVDGRIVVTISSQVKVVSTLSMPIQLLVNDPTWASPVEIGILYPHRESAVPVMASLGTELRVRPLADAVYSWSAPIPIQTRSEVDLRVESSSSEAARNAIFCVSMILDESLRVVTFGEPIVLVNKLPVGMAFRVKSSLGGNGTATGSSASPRERMQVGEKRGVWWTDHRSRPQFELAINGCQTSRWIELTQAANMSSKSGGTTGDVVSVMLLRQDGRPFKLLLQIVEQAPAKSLHIHMYAEMWFINRTGLDLVFGNESEAESYFPPANARTLVGNAQISAYSSSSESPTPGAPNVRLAMPSCAWSSRFTADPRRLSWQDECLTLKADGGRSGNGINMLYEFGISADYSTRHFGSITTLISVIPRYLIVNQSSQTVLLLEDGTSGKNGAMFSGTGEAHHVVAKGEVYALYWVSGVRSRLRTSVLSDFGQYGWSESISYDQVKSHVVVVPIAPREGVSLVETVKLQVSIKQGSISQASLVVVITDLPEHETSSASVNTTDARGGWDVLTIHTQLAGLIVTVADKKAVGSGSDSSNLFGSSSSITDERVARLTVTRVTAEVSSSTRDTSVRLNVMGIKVEDLLQRSKNLVVLRPVSRNDSFSSSRRDANSGDKCFLAITFLEKPHPKYRWIERIHVEVQDVRVATSMRFVNRLNKLTAETLAHFDSHTYATTLSVFDDVDGDGAMQENILDYFVTTDDDAAMASITGHKVYIESCEIAPVRVVVSFSREKGDIRNDPNAGFWLSNLKFKIDNAYLTLDAFKLSHAMATQEALVESLSAFYVKSVKSQALGLIESVQVTTLVTSVVASGVSSLVSTIMGKTDPSLANAKHSFQYQFLTNNQLITKHSKMLAECQSTAQFLQQVRHLVYDWDSNHTGLEARGCVALGILNNSRHSLVVNVQLNDGAEIRVLPVGRKHLASAMGGDGGDPNSWRSERSMVIFAWGYTPTLLTSGDVYFTVQSNACNVFVTRKTARLKANIGYTATFTHQEKQQWWSTNVVIVGDDLHGHVSGASSLFGEAASTPMGMVTPALPPMPLQPSQSSGMLDDEYEVVFTTPSLGLIAKQSGPRQVIVRECLMLENGTPSPALASGKIAPGDTILTVSGVGVTNTSQFRDLVGQSPRPVVLRFRRTGERFNASEAFDLFGEKQPRGDAYDLFGTGR